MAAPNLINLTSITGNTVFLNVTTVATNVVANPVSSGEVFKINTIMVANVDGANSADVTASFFRTGVENKFASTVTVPADATLVLISKDTCIYLEEGDYIRMTASANNDLWATCSYEEMR